MKGKQELSFESIFDIRIAVEKIRRGQVFAADLTIYATMIPTNVDIKQTAARISSALTRSAAPKARQNECRL